MGIKSNFSLSDMMKNHEAFIQNVERNLFLCLDSTLIEIQNQSKMKVNANEKVYKDRTNVLNSSIGYVIYKDGELIKSNFSSSGTGREGDGTAGKNKGENLAIEIGKQFTKGYVCVLVAGADYAVYVESKQYDVTSGSWMQFDNIFTENAKNFLEHVGLKFNKIK